jgi:hypothetical protein
MAIPVTKTEPPKPGMVRLSREFGVVDHRYGQDIASISLQVGTLQASDGYFSLGIFADSNGAGPVGDFSADLVVKMLRSLADQVERFSQPPIDQPTTRPLRPLHFSHED